MLRKIDVEEMLKLIVVSPPYFALTDIYQDQEKLFAKVASEQACGLEAKPMSSAEIGRHMAVLGECALAVANKGREPLYFLAKQAKYTRLSDIDRPAELTMDATINWAKPKSASAAITLFADKDPMVALDIDYFPLPRSSFERSFSAKKREEIIYGDRSPYAQLPDFLQVNEDKDQLIATLGAASAEWCQGHFKNYPTLPAAMLMGKVLNLFEEHLRRALRRPFRFYVQTGLLTAQNIAFAGEKVSIISKLNQLTGDKALIAGHVFNENGEVITDLKAALKICFRE